MIFLINRFALFAFFVVDEITAEGAKTGYKRFIMKISDRIYRIDRINSSCKSCNPVYIYIARLPEVIADLYHLNTSLKLPVGTEPGGIRLKIMRRRGEAR